MVLSVVGSINNERSIKMEMFVNEDLSKPENRINLAMFQLLQQNWFVKWFCESLDLPEDVVIYPPENIAAGRPDLAAKRDKRIIAYIEVECGSENKEQLVRYNNISDDVRIISIVGKISFGGDLSLDEIMNFVKNSIVEKKLDGQKKISAEYLVKLIELGTNGRTSQSLPIAPVSENRKVKKRV